MIDHYDVVVIGGGIHGVGVAQAAAADGYSVLVLEQGALAGGTSSRSSKLIHGGLRYLEQGQLGLVRECLYERNLLLKLAPELVKLRPFLVPVYKESSRSRIVMRAGLSLYALLGGAGKNARFKSLPRQQWDNLDGLLTRNLQAVFQYNDAQTNDVALTHAVMASAQTLGAELKLNAEFLGATLHSRDNGLRYRHGNEEKLCRATVIVNAAGPWVNSVLARVTPDVPGLAVELVQGTHVVLEGKKERGIYYLESPQDRRPIFVMPWQKDGRDAVLVGTTETTFVGDPANVNPLPEEQRYLLKAYLYYFSSSALQLDNVVKEAFAGLRVLPLEGESHGVRSRDTILFPDRKGRPRLVTIYGGKLTAYRATAEKLMAMLHPSLPHRKAVASTRKLLLGPVSNTD